MLLSYGPDIRRLQKRQQMGHQILKYMTMKKILSKKNEDASESKL